MYEPPLNDEPVVSLYYNLNAIATLMVGICPYGIAAFHDTIFNMCVISNIHII